MRTILKWIQASREVAAAPSTGPDQGQRARLQAALAVLVVALIVVVVRDIHDLRPPAPVSPEIAASPEPNNPPASVAAPERAPETPVPPEPKRPPTSAKAKQTRVKRPVVNATQSLAINGTAAGPTIVATDRAVLPPLQVEVVAGNQRRSLATSSNSVKVDMQSGVSPGASQPNASEPQADSRVEKPSATAKVSLSPDVAAHVAHSVAPRYPLLAKQMKVQGAVVLQALIDKGGKIQSLRVLSGPTILAAAAQEAVKQWRFKPYYQNGEPVETEARVSVNFTISTF
jgi:protein TonB